MSAFIAPSNGLHQRPRAGSTETGDSFQDWLVHNLDIKAQDIEAAARQVHSVQAAPYSLGPAQNVHFAVDPQEIWQQPAEWPWQQSAAAVGLGFPSLYEQSYPVTIKQEAQNGEAVSAPAKTKSKSKTVGEADPSSPKPKRYRSNAQREAHRRYRERKKQSVCASFAEYQPEHSGPACSAECLALLWMPSCSHHSSLCALWSS